MPAKDLECHSRLRPRAPLPWQKATDPFTRVPPLRCQSIASCKFLVVQPGLCYLLEVKAWLPRSVFSCGPFPALPAAGLGLPASVWLRVKLA